MEIPQLLTWASCQLQALVRVWVFLGSQILTSTHTLAVPQLLPVQVSIFLTISIYSSSTFLPDYYNCYIYPISISYPILLYMDIMSLCMYVVYM